MAVRKAQYKQDAEREVRKSRARRLSMEHKAGKTGAPPPQR